MLELFDDLMSPTSMFLLADVAIPDVTSEGAVESFFSIQGLLTLGMLVLLQAVLGFDNLLYISIESKRVPEDKQSMVRKLGIGLAIVFRIGLLFVLVNLVESLQEVFLRIRHRLHRRGDLRAQFDCAFWWGFYSVDGVEGDLSSIGDS